MTTWRDGNAAWVPTALQRVCKATVLPCLLLISVTAGVRNASVTPSSSVLEDAWRFASSITNDPNDRARCQAEVARAWLAVGEPARAVACAAQAGGWRGLAVTADAAAWFAGRGQTNEAGRVLMEAEYRAPGLKDWPYDRVQLHIARAKALLGGRADLMRLAETYRDNRDCSGALYSSLALEAARRGEVEDAQQWLARIEAGGHLDLVSARAAGFRELAVCTSVPPTHASNMMERAWAEASGASGWLRHDLRLDLVDALCEAGLKDSARARLALTADELRAAELPGHIKAPRLAGTALRCAKLGVTNTMTVLEAECLPLMRSSMELIEQPPVLAVLGEARATVGDVKASIEHFSTALEIAAGLVNRRPRAIACVEVMLAMARAGVDPQPFEERRRSLLAGLEDRAL